MQEVWDLALFIVAQWKAEDAVSGIPEGGIPEAHVYRNEGWLTLLSQDERNAIVFDDLGWTQITQPLHRGPARERDKNLKVEKLIVQNDLAHDPGVSRDDR
jgi:hypothetical protein